MTEIEARYFRRTAASRVGWALAGVLGLAAMPVWVWWGHDEARVFALLFFAVIALLVLYAAFSADAGYGTLAVGADGLWLQSLLPTPWRAGRVAWQDIQRIELERIFGMLWLVAVRHDRSRMSVQIVQFGEPAAIVAAIREHVELDPEPLLVGWQLPAALAGRTRHARILALALMLFALALFSNAVSPFWYGRTEPWWPFVGVGALVGGAVGGWLARVDRREQLAVPVLTLLATFALAGTVSYAALAGHRLYTALRPLQIELVEVEYTGYAEDAQRWELRDGSGAAFMVPRHDKPAYDDRRQPGERQRISVRRGRFNTVAVAHAALGDTP